MLRWPPSCGVRQVGAPLSRATFQGSLEGLREKEEVPVATKQAWALFKEDVPPPAVRLLNQVAKHREEQLVKVTAQSPT